MTHLPQVAAYADQHVRVFKEPGEDGRSVTQAEVLDKEEARVRQTGQRVSLWTLLKLSALQMMPM